MIRLILLLAIAATADNVTIWGAGVNSCGKVLSGRVESSEGGLVLDWPTGQWVLGYLSATVAIAPKLNPDLSSLDSYAITAFIVKHCEDNPLANLKDASIALIRAKLEMDAARAKPAPPLK